MKYWVLAVMSAAVAVTVGIVQLALGDAAVSGGINRFFVLNAKMLAVLGGVIAAAQFTPGDYLRRAWVWMAVGSMLLVEADLYAQIIGPTLSGDAPVVGRGLIVILANIASPFALILFARAVRIAGLDIAGTPRARYLAIVAAAAVAFAMAGESVVIDSRALLAGDYRHLSMLASDFGDIISLILIAPLVYNVITLRGGALQWPFIMIATSSLSWLVYDGADMVQRFTGGEHLFFDSLQQSARVAACMFLFSAGIAQRWAVARGPQSAAGTGAQAQAA